MTCRWKLIWKLIFRIRYDRLTLIPYKKEKMISYVKFKLLNEILFLNNKMHISCCIV